MPANRGSHGHLWDQPRSGEPGCSWALGHMRSASAFSLPAGPCRRPRGPSCRQMILILACGQFLDDTLKWEATLFIVGRFQPLKELEPFPTLACDLRPKTWFLVPPSALNLFCGESSEAYDHSRAKSDSPARSFSAYVICKKAIYRCAPKSRSLVRPGYMCSSDCLVRSASLLSPSFSPSAAPFQRDLKSSSSAATGCYRFLLLDSTCTQKPVIFPPPGLLRQGEVFSVSIISLNFKWLSFL